MTKGGKPDINFSFLEEKLKISYFNTFKRKTSLYHLKLDKALHPNLINSTLSHSLYEMNWHSFWFETDLNPMVSIIQTTLLSQTLILRPFWSNQTQIDYHMKPKKCITDETITNNTISLANYISKTNRQDAHGKLTNTHDNPLLGLFLEVFHSCLLLLPELGVFSMLVAFVHAVAFPFFSCLCPMFVGLSSSMVFLRHNIFFIIIIYHAAFT